MRFRAHRRLSGGRGRRRLIRRARARITTSSATLLTLSLATSDPNTVLYTGATTPGRGSLSFFRPTTTLPTPSPLARRERSRVPGHEHRQRKVGSDSPVFDPICQSLLYYDYALTWTREVQYVWLKKFTISTALYIACRYAMVANVLYTLALAEKLPTLRVSSTPAHYLSGVESLTSGRRHCDGGYQISSALSVVGRTAIIVVWGARTYAVFNRNKWILALFGSLGLAIIALAALGVPYVSCTTAKGSPPYIHFKGDPPWRNVLVVLTVVYESLSAILTTCKSLMGMKVNGTWRLNQQGLTYRVLEQGLLYFVFVSAFSIASLILQFRAPAGSFLQRLLNALTLPLSGLMTARFLLHLRGWEYSTSHVVDMDHRPHFGSSLAQSHQYQTYLDTQTQIQCQSQSGMELRWPTSPRRDERDIDRESAWEVDDANANANGKGGRADADAVVHGHGIASRQAPEHQTVVHVTVEESTMVVR